MSEEQKKSFMVSQIIVGDEIAMRMGDPTQEIYVNAVVVNKCVGKGYFFLSFGEDDEATIDLSQEEWRFAGSAARRVNRRMTGKLLKARRTLT